MSAPLFSSWAVQLLKAPQIIWDSQIHSELQKCSLHLYSQMLLSGGRVEMCVASSAWLWKAGPISRCQTCPDHLLPRFSISFGGYSRQLDRLQKAGRKITRVKLQMFIIRIFHFKVLEFTKKRGLKDVDQPCPCRHCRPSQRLSNLSAALTSTCEGRIIAYLRMSPLI